MLVWAAIIAGLMILGMLPVFLGLFVGFVAEFVDVHGVDSVECVLSPVFLQGFSPVRKGDLS